MTTVLLTGGTGFIGGHLRAALRGSRVILLGRKKPALLNNERWRYVDMAGPLVPEKLQGGEVLCHLAYSWTAGRENVAYNRRLLDAANASPGIKRVILCSSTSVYGVSRSPVIDEESSCEPVGEYATTKLACEMLWREGLRDDCSLTVLRPSEVIGPGGVGLLPLIRDATQRPVLGAIKRGALYHRRLHYVAVSNVVAAVRFCLERRQDSPQEIYIVSDDHQPENRNYATMQDAVRSASGRRPFPGIAMPRWVLTVLGKATGRPALGVEQIFSSRKLHDAGFEDAISLYDEVRRTVQSFEQPKRRS
jgi:nucleoside-diphosphate-sugar epimerase